MIEEFISSLPEVYFDPDDPSAWKIAIKIREQELGEMETPNYKQREQEKMKRLGFDITVTDEMISERYHHIKKELDFAKKQLERLIDQSQN